MFPDDPDCKWLRKNLIEAQNLAAQLKRVLERCGLVDELDEHFVDISNTIDELWENR